MTDLQDVLDLYDHDTLYVQDCGSDGVRVVYNPDGTVIWRWDPAHDAPPTRALLTLFEEVGLDVERM